MLSWASSDQAMLYVRAALQALAESSLTNTFKGLFEAPKRLSSGTRFERTCLSFILGGGLISGIRMHDRTCPHLLLGIVDDAFRFCNRSFENPLVMFDSALRRQPADLDSLDYYATESSNS